jgi:dTDP-4-dehydrorhamnose reductase
MKVVILGNGLLGKELAKLTQWDSVSRKTHDFDFKDVTSCYRFIKDYDVIVNCIAHTDTYDKEKEKHWNINFKAVSRLTDWCRENNKKLVHISTDYVYANTNHVASEEEVPVHAENWYSYTKLLADGYIELKSEDYLIIRCGHKPAPFKFPKAYDDMLGNFDYVNIIAKGIIDLIKHNKSGIYNVGTEQKSMYDLALITNIDVEKDKAPGWMPKDIRMNCDKYKRAVGYDLDGKYDHLQEWVDIKEAQMKDTAFRDFQKRQDNFEDDFENQPFGD